MAHPQDSSRPHPAAFPPDGYTGQPAHSGPYPGQAHPQLDAPIDVGIGGRILIALMVGVIAVTLCGGAYYFLHGTGPTPFATTGSGGTSAPAAPAGLGPSGAYTISQVIPPAGAVGADRSAIPDGSNPSAKVVLTIYEDFRCTFCATAESTEAAVYQSMADTGQIQVQYHLVNLVDRSTVGTSGSLDAANAAACAQDEGKFSPYHRILFANQPNETNDLYGDPNELITLAKQVPGLDTASFESCVTSGKHDGWVAKNYTSLLGVLGQDAYVPYYAINGKVFSGPSSDTGGQGLKSALQAAINAS